METAKAIGGNGGLDSANIKDQNHAKNTSKSEKRTSPLAGDSEGLFEVSEVTREKLASLTTQVTNDGTMGKDFPDGIMKNAKQIVEVERDDKVSQAQLQRDLSKNRKTSIDEEIASFVLSEKIDEILNEQDKEFVSQNADLDCDIEKDVILLQTLKLERSELEKWLEQYGIIEERIRKDALLYQIPAFPVIAGAADFAISQNALWEKFIKDDAEPLAMALAITIGIASHSAGVVKAKNKKFFRPLLAAGLGLQGALVILRGSLEGYDEYMLITSLIIAILFGLGIYLTAYGTELGVNNNGIRKKKKEIHNKTIELQEVDAEHDIVAERLDALKKRKRILSANHNSINTREKAAEKMAKAHLAKLNIDSRNEKNRTTELQSILDRVIKFWEGKIEECGNELRSAYMSAYRKGQRRGGNPTVKLSTIALIMIMFVSSCNRMDSNVSQKNDDTHHHEIQVYLDRSTSMTNEYVTKKTPLIDHIANDLLNLDEISSKRIGARVRLFVVAASSIPVEFIAELPMGRKDGELRKGEREAEVHKFHKDLDSIVNVGFSLGLQNKTHLHRSVAQGLESLVGLRADQKDVIILSDMLEANGTLNFENYIDSPNVLNEKRVDFMERLTRNYPLPNSLSTISIRIVSLSIPEDRHTDDCLNRSDVRHIGCEFKNDEAVFQAAQIFKDLYSARGANAIVERGFLKL